jgi:hypothetical protein
VGKYDTWKESEIYVDPMNQINSEGLEMWLRTKNREAVRAPSYAVAAIPLTLDGRIQLGVAYFLVENTHKCILKL